MFILTYKNVICFVIHNGEINLFKLFLFFSHGIIILLFIVWVIDTIHVFCFLGVHAYLSHMLAGHLVTIIILYY